MIYINKYHSLKTIRKIQRKIYSMRDYTLIKKNKKSRILVILHLFYLESLEEIIEYLKNLSPYQWDLVVTCPISLKNDLNADQISSIHSSARVFFFENRGYDIGPFMQVLHYINLDKYDIVFKLQSKGVKRKKIYIYHQLFFGRQWFVNLFEGCIGARVVHKTIDNLLSDNKAGLIAAQNLIVQDPLYKSKLVQRELKNEKLAYGTSNYKFVAGTCFAMKPSILMGLQRLNYTSEKFELFVPEIGMSLAHVLERYFTIYVNSEGYRIIGNNVCNVKRLITKPLEILLARISSERLLTEPYEINDYFFHKYLDNKFILYQEKRVPINTLKIFDSQGTVKKLNEDFVRNDVDITFKNNDSSREETIIINSKNIILFGYDILKSKLNIDPTIKFVKVLEIRFINKNGLQ